MKRLIALPIVAVALLLSGQATAATKQLHNDYRLDTAASQIAGFPLRVAGEDDPYEWSTFLPSGICSECVVGFTFPYAPASSVLYHWLFMSPRIWSDLQAIENGTQIGAYEEAVAIMTLTHESYHQRLYSIDEGRVNACALQAFPAVIQADFNVTSTLNQPFLYRVRVVRRVRRHHQWVRVARYVVQTRYQAVENPAYSELIADAHLFYNSQPAPYSTGTCW